MLNNIFRRREDQKRISDQGRLPPGQSLTNKFPILHVGPVPAFNPATWNLRVWGEVEEEVSLTWNVLEKLPRTRLVMDIHCVTRWSKFDTLWEGFSVRSMLEHGLFKLKPSAHFVMQHAEYGYTVNLPLEGLLAENFLLATHFAGEPLTPEHGYPLRGIVGSIVGRDDIKTPYIWKGAKWLRGLEFMTSDRPGYWEKGGYHMEADVWKEERYA